MPGAHGVRVLLARLLGLGRSGGLAMLELAWRAMSRAWSLSPLGGKEH